MPSLNSRAGNFNVYRLLKKKLVNRKPLTPMYIVTNPSVMGSDCCAQCARYMASNDAVRFTVIPYSSHIFILSCCQLKQCNTMFHFNGQ